MQQEPEVAILSLHFKWGNGARGGTRTPTVARWILNPVRLPIPPLSLFVICI